jgi:hypothetical protein
VPNATGTNVLLRYIPEVTWGTTPATPTMQALRVTSVTPKYNRTTVQSKELTTAREIADYIRTDESSGLAFNHEMSFGNLDDVLVNLMGGTWSTNVLKIGTTRSSHTVELGLSDISQFCTFKGAMYTSLGLTVSRGQIIGGSAEFLSNPGVWATATGATAVTAAETNNIMDPISSVQLVSVAGTPVTGPQEFTINAKNNLIPFPQLTSLTLADLQLGQIEWTGTLKQYFSDRVLVDQAVAFSDAALSFTIGGSSTKKYNFLFNKSKLTLTNIANLNVNGAVVAEFAYSAKTDATDTTCMITRTP